MHVDRPGPRSRRSTRRRDRRRRRGCRSSERRLFWTGIGGDPDGGRNDVLGSWGDLAERERGLGMRSGQPILLAPDGRADPRLSTVFRHRDFARKAEGTKETYAPDYQLFSSTCGAADFVGTRRRRKCWRTGGCMARGTRLRSVGRSGRGSWPRSGCSTRSPSGWASCRRPPCSRAGVQRHRVSSVIDSPLSSSPACTARSTWRARCPSSAMLPVVRCVRSAVQPRVSGGPGPTGGARSAARGR